MQDKEIKYLPIVVEKVDGEASLISEVKGLIQSGLWVKSKNLRTLDDLKVEDAERYRLELKRVYMDYSKNTLDEIFGTHFINHIIEFPVNEFFAKVRKYENTPPRVGEIWKRIVDEIEVIIRSVDRSIEPIKTVKVYYAKDGASGFLYLSDLEKNYIKTGKSCNSLIPFINELNRLNA